MNQTIDSLFIMHIQKMKSILKRTIISLQDFVKERTPVSKKTNDPVEIWQRKFFYQIIGILAPLSLLAYIPSLLASLNDQLTFLAIVDTLAFLSVQVLFFARSITLENKKLILLAGLFAVGVSLIVSIGFGGPGMIYLTAVTAITTLIYKPLFGFITIALNSVIMIFTYFLDVPISMINDTVSGTSFQVILTFTANYILLNLILVSAIASLIKSTTKEFEKEKVLSKTLEVKNKEYEEAMKKACESDKLKNSFLANMNHEVRTPLNGIIGFSQLMKYENDRETLHKYSDQVTNSGLKLLQILTDVVDSSKITSNQVKVRKSQIIFSQFFSKEKAIWDQIAASLNKSHLIIIIDDNSDNCPVEIYADEDKLSKVFLHLVSNAIQYTDQGTVKICCDIETAKKQIRFTVKDTGIGISVEDQQTIFEPFIQSEDLFNEGNGLGLYIVKGFVEAWGGKVSLSSYPNLGSTFTFTLPL